MNLKPITTKQFIGWMAITGIGVALWIFLPQPLMALSYVFLVLSNFFVLTPSDRREPVTRKHVFLIFTSIIAFFALMHAARHWLPDGQAREILRFIKHPGFILSFWSVGIYVAHRRWRQGKQVEDNNRE